MEDKKFADISIDKVEKKLNSLKNDAIPYILVSTGSFAPVHLSHIKIMELAKQHMEKQSDNMACIGGFLSPSHDSYVTSKLKRLGCSSIDGYSRFKMIDLACNDSDWLQGSSYEVRSTTFRDINEATEYVRDHIKKSLISKYPSLSKLKVFYVCGSDLALKCYMYASEMDFCNGVICIARPCEETTILKKQSKFFCKSFKFLENSSIEDLSSTNIRKLLMQNASDDELKNHLPLPAIKYLKEQNITIKKIGYY